MRSCLGMREIESVTSWGQWAIEQDREANARKWNRAGAFVFHISRLGFILAGDQPGAKC